MSLSVLSETQEPLSVQAPESGLSYQRRYKSSSSCSQRREIAKQVSFPPKDVFFQVPRPYSIASKQTPLDIAEFAKRTELVQNHVNNM